MSRCIECLKPAYLVRMNINDQNSFYTKHTIAATLKKPTEVKVLGNFEPHGSGLCRGCLRTEHPAEFKKLENKKTIERIVYMESVKNL